ncbi:MAG: TetR/AcrR family transcriptional regulator [Promethearchaeota archaeon]
MVKEPRKKGTEEETKGTKEKIRDVAIDLFSLKGYNAVSVRDIARLVNIHESSIYSHYKGKEDIMDSIISYLIEETKSSSTPVPLDQLLEKYEPEILLDNAIRPMIEQLKAPTLRKILRLMWIELYQNDKFLDFFKNQFIEPSYVLWTSVFQKMMDIGYIIEYDAKVLAHEFFNYCIYLFFEGFILNYDESNYNDVIDTLNTKLSDHIKFILDMVKKNRFQK